MISPRRSVLTVCIILAVALFYSLRSAAPKILTHQPLPIQSARTGQVIEAFQHAWTGYSKHCFGHDTLRPVTNTCQDEFGGYGATAIDALPTAIIFRQEDTVLQILRLIADLDFRIVREGSKIQVFEVTIRHFAGMLSAWDLLNGPFTNLAKNAKLRQALYNQMVVLGDILSCAFNTPSGIPREWVDPLTGQTDKGSSNTVAGAGTTILEFAKLSDITGNKTYARLAERAEAYLLNPTPASYELYPGLVGSLISVRTGELVDSRGSWGGNADSFYEYLLKAYIYNSGDYGFYLDRWLVAADSTIKSIGSHPYGHPELTFLSSWDSTSTHKRMESLSWFAGGSFIFGGMVTDNQTLVDYGLSIADAAGAVYMMTKTGLGAEFVTWKTECKAGKRCNPKSSIQIADGKFRLRPEVLETWYHAYRATKNPKYREWSWAAFEAINRHCRTDSGFSGIDNVNAVDGGGKTDVQESFIFAEVLKYLYLTHVEDEDMPFHVQDGRKGVKNTWVFNTEAHPFKVAGLPV